MTAHLYDLAFGPRNPHERECEDPSIEWVDPFAWVDLRLSAATQARANVKTGRYRASFEVA